MCFIYIFKIKYYLVLKKEKYLVEKIWINLEDIIISVVKELQIIYYFICMWNLNNIDLLVE